MHDGGEGSERASGCSGPSDVGGASREEGGDRFGTTALSGAKWMALSAGSAAGLAALSQILLAKWLTAADFGLFALTIATAFVFVVASDGGLQTAMTQRSATKALDMGPSVLRLGVFIASVAAVALMLISPLAATVFDQPKLTALLVVAALALPLKPVAAIASSVLRIELRFSLLAVVMLAAAASHYGTSLVLASLGWGAMSLVIGMQVGVVVMAGGTLFAARATPWYRGKPKSGLVESWRVTRWPLLGDIAAQSSGRIDYFVLGLFAPAAAVGVYYFAFQLVAKFSELVYVVSTNVLYPALAHIDGEHTRQTSNMFRAGTALTAAAAVAGAAAIAVISPVEEMLWAGRWEIAVVAISALASVLPLQAALQAPEQLMKAKGAFRTWTAVLFGRAGGVGIGALVVGTGVVAAITPTSVAVGMAVFFGFGALVELFVISRIIGFSGSGYLVRVAPVWIVMISIGWGASLVVKHIDATGVGAFHLPAILSGLAIVLLGAAIVSVPLYRALRQPT